jgi:hypothetical protein
MKSNQWIYIQTQIEEVIAAAMIAEGKISRLPHSEGIDGSQYSVIVPHVFVAEFHRRIADLRA